MSTPATTPAPPQDLQKQITAADLSTANGNDSKNLWVGLYVATLGMFFTLYSLSLMFPFSLESNIFNSITLLI
jgi:hypothetical protein